MRSAARLRMYRAEAPHHIEGDA